MVLIILIQSQQNFAHTDGLAPFCPRPSAVMTKFVFYIYIYIGCATEELSIYTTSRNHIVCYCCGRFGGIKSISGCHIGEQLLPGVGSMSSTVLVLRWLQTICLTVSNSLVPKRWRAMFKWGILRHILETGILYISPRISIKWMPQNHLKCRVTLITLYCHIL